MSNYSSHSLYSSTNAGYNKTTQCSALRNHSCRYSANYRTDNSNYKIAYVHPESSYNQSTGTTSRLTYRSILGNALFTMMEHIQKK
ncbi:MAG: hypothetical protein ACI4V7_07850 [Succinivibrionaceae bacterium]